MKYAVIKEQWQPPSQHQAEQVDCRNGWYCNASSQRYYAEIFANHSA